MGFDINRFLDQREVASKEQGFDSSSFLTNFNRGSGNFARDINRPDTSKQKGFIRQTTEALAGGATDAAELWMRALRAIDPQGGNETLRNFATHGLSSIKNFVAKHPSLAPDANVEEGVRRWWVEGVRSLIPSLVPTAIAAGAGIAAAPFTGGASLAGIAAGSGALSGAIFGFAELDQFHEDVEDRIDELGLEGAEAEELRVQARNPAIWSAITEGGLEAAANALQTLTLGRFLPAKKALKGMVKGSVKSLFTKTGKEALKGSAKALAISSGAEVSTEFAQSALENKFRKDIGLTDLSSISQGFQAMGPAFVTSLLFFGAGKATNAAQRYGIRTSLESGKVNPNRRLSAVRQIANTIRATKEEGSEQVAIGLERSARRFIAKDLDMNIDTDVGLFNTLGEYAYGLDNGTIDIENVIKTQKQLQEDLTQEQISNEDRFTGTRLVEGLGEVIRDHEAKQVKLDAVKKKEASAPKVEKTEADMLEDVAKQALDGDIGEEVSTKKVKVSEPNITTKDIQRALLTNSRAALGVDTAPERQQAEYEKDAEAVGINVTEQLKEERKVERAGAHFAQKEEARERAEAIDRQREVDAVEAGVMKQAKEGIAAEKGGQELEDVIAQKKSEISETQPVDTEEVTEEEEAPEKSEEKIEEKLIEDDVIPEDTEEGDERPDALTPEQAKDIRKELKDPDITEAEKKDLEGALTAAGLPVVLKPTERQRTNLRKKIDKQVSKHMGLVPVGKKPKGKAPTPTQAAELTKQRGKLLQQLATLRKNADSVSNEALIEEVKTQVGEVQTQMKELHNGGREKIVEGVEDTIIELSDDTMTIEQAARAAVETVIVSDIEQAGTVDKNGVRTTYLGITTDLIKDGQANLRGRTISGARELAAMSQVFANPQFETLRVVYMKGRTVVDHEGITSRLPSTIKAFSGSEQRIEAKREELGADAVYLVHNHPSGDPTPSKADTKMTEVWGKAIKGLRGHVVINSDKFAFINPSGGVQQSDIKTDRPDLVPSIPNRIVKERIKSVDDIASLSKRMQNPKGFINAIFLDSKNKVRSIQEVPIGHDQRSMSKLLREQAAKSGSPKMYLTFNTDIHPELVNNKEKFASLLARGVVNDVIGFNTDGLQSMAEDTGLTNLFDSKFFHGERIVSEGFAEDVETIKPQKKAAKVTKEVEDNEGFKNNPDAKKIMEEKMGPSFKRTSFKEMWKEFTTNLSLRLRQGIIDQYASLSHLSDRVWKMAHTTTSVDGAVDVLFHWGAIKLDKEGVITIADDEGGQGLRDLLQPLGKEVNNLLGWIAANRSNELIKPTKEHPKGREQNLTQDQINKLLKLSDGNMPDGSSRLSTYRKANKKLMKLHQSVLDVGVKTGTINKQEREKWDTDFYIPFFRLLAEQNETRGPKTLAGLTNQDAIKNLKGSEAPVADMLSNIMQNWNHILGASMKNQVANEALAIATAKTVDGDPIATKISDDIEVVENSETGEFDVVHVPSDSLRGSYKTYEKAQERADQVTDQTAQARARKGDRIVYTRQDGNKVWFEVHEPNTYQALTAMQWQGFNSGPIKAMRTFKRWLTMGVTASPAFKIRNLLRDTISTLGVSKISVNIMDNMVVGKEAVGGIFKHKMTASEARTKAGGGFISYGHIYGTSSEKTAAQIRRNLKDENILDNDKGRAKYKLLLRKSLKWYGEVGNKLENINRAALAQQELARGKGSLEANFSARDLLDFQRQGAYPIVRFLTDTVPFMNARIQGIDKLGRAFVDSKESRNRALMMVGAVAAASTALYLMYKDDDDFKAREEWDRDTYWWFKLPGTDTAMRIPKPFEIGAIGTLGERMIEQFADDKAHFPLFVERALFAIEQTFSMDFKPQAIKPLLELAANKNSFTERPIETMAMARLSPTERRKAWTSETSILLSKGFSKIPWEKVQLSPVQIEHLVQGYFGWLGAASVEMVDKILVQSGAFPVRPAARIEETPFIGSFFRTTPARQTKYATVFYEQLREMNETYADIRNYRMLGDVEKSINLARKEKDNLKFRRYANRIQKQVAKLTRRMKLIRLSDSMTPLEKRIKLDRVSQQKNRLLKISTERMEI